MPRILSSTLAAACLIIVSSATASAPADAPFVARPDPERWGVGIATWQFESKLSPEATGWIEVCYREDGPEQILGRVQLRPFVSQPPGVPDLKLLLSKTDLHGNPHFVLIVSYGLRTGTFVVQVPGLAAHGWFLSGPVVPDNAGDYLLVGVSKNGSVRYENNQPAGLTGRLYFRFVDVNRPTRPTSSP